MVWEANKVPPKFFQDPSQILSAGRFCVNVTAVDYLLPLRLTLSIVSIFCLPEVWGVKRRVNYIAEGTGKKLERFFQKKLDNSWKRFWKKDELKVTNFVLTPIQSSFPDLPILSWFFYRILPSFFKFGFSYSSFQDSLKVLPIVLPIKMHQTILK